MTLDLLQRTQLQQLNKITTALTRLDDPEPPNSFLDLSEREKKSWSLFRAISGIISISRGGRWDGLEKECHEQLKKKLEREPDHQGAILVPYDVLTRELTAASNTQLVAGTVSGGSFIEALRRRMLVLRTGAVLLPGQRANLAMPRIATSATAYWLPTEATATTESQQTFESVTMTPHTVASYTEISRQLLLQANPPAEAVVMNDHAGILGVGVDTAVLAGTGADGQPSGLCAGASANVGSVTGATVNYDDMLEFQSDVLTENALINPATCAYFAPVAIARLLANRQRFTNVNSPLWEGNLANGMVAGFPALSTESMPAAMLLFGDWSTVMIAEWGALELQADPFTSFKQGIVGLRAMWTVDVGFRHYKSFSLATSVT